MKRLLLSMVALMGATLCAQPTPVTPTSGSTNGLTITATTGTFTLSNGKTLTVSNTLNFAGTDGSTLNIGTGGTLGSAAFTAASAYATSGALTTSGLTMSTARLLGRTTASTGAIEEISTGTSLSLSGGSLNAIQDIRTSASPTFASPTVTTLIVGSSEAVLSRADTAAIMQGTGSMIAALPGYNIANGASTYSYFSASDGTKQFIAGIDHTLTIGKMGMLTNHGFSIIVNNGAVLAFDTSLNSTFSGNIKTAAPTAGSAGAWKLGALITTTGLLVSTTQAVRINIGGTDYSLAVLTTNP